MIEIIGGPDRDRTDDLFHAMEARSQLRHRPTLGKDLYHSEGAGTQSQTPRHMRGQIECRTGDRLCSHNSPSPCTKRELITYPPVSKVVE